MQQYNQLEVNKYMHNGVCGYQENNGAILHHTFCKGVAHNPVSIWLWQSSVKYEFRGLQRDGSGKTRVTTLDTLFTSACNLLGTSKPNLPSIRRASPFLGVIETSMDNILNFGEISRTGRYLEEISLGVGPKQYCHIQPTGYREAPCHGTAMPF
jgi:hypothetical protein